MRLKAPQIFVGVVIGALALYFIGDVILDKPK